MKAHAKQPLDEDRRARIYEFLLENIVGALSTVTPDGDPHVAAIYYFVNPDFSVSFITKSGTRKHDNIVHNNHVMLLVFDAQSQATAQLQGRAHKIEDAEEAHEVFSKLLRASWRSSEDSVPPITQLAAGEYVAYKITPSQVRMAVYSRPEFGSHEELFETIEAHELKI